MYGWRIALNKQRNINQGVRQGGVASTSDYKAYCNDLLLMAENMNIGLCIGDIFIAAPACADDIIFMASDHYSLQCLLNLAKLYADQERYVVHPQKSVVALYDIDVELKEMLIEEKIFQLGQDTMPIVTIYASRH